MHVHPVCCQSISENRAATTSVGHRIPATRQRYRITFHCSSAQALTHFVEFFAGNVVLPVCGLLRRCWQLPERVTVTQLFINRRIEKHLCYLTVFSNGVFPLDVFVAFQPVAEVDRIAGRELSTSTESPKHSARYRCVVFHFFSVLSSAGMPSFSLRPRLTNRSMNAVSLWDCSASGLCLAATSPNSASFACSSSDIGDSHCAAPMSITCPETLWIIKASTNPATASAWRLLCPFNRNRRRFPSNVN